MSLPSFCQPSPHPYPEPLLWPHPSTKLLLSQLPDLRAARFSRVSVFIFPKLRQHLAQSISPSCLMHFLLAPPRLHSPPSPTTWPPCWILLLVLILEHHSRIQSLGLYLAQSLDDLSSPKDLKYESSSLSLLYLLLCTPLCSISPLNMSQRNSLETCDPKPTPLAVSTPQSMASSCFQLFWIEIFLHCRIFVFLMLLSFTSASQLFGFLSYVSQALSCRLPASVCFLLLHLPLSPHSPMCLPSALLCLFTVLLWLHVMVLFSPLTESLYLLGYRNYSFALQKAQLLA